ncbi:MAG: TlpA disulfide reductase family protein [Opitutaceae bacterium]|jgi:thiol-disulfide isomerase/thioredoxin
MNLFPANPLTRTGCLRGALLGIALAFAPGALAQIKVGDPFPSLQSVGFSGALPDARDKVILVDFWASWCAPCRASFPAYGRIQSEFAARGLVIVAVSVDKTPADYAAFVRRMAPPFFTALDPGQKLVREVRVPTMPTSFLVGRDGRVRYIHKGFHSGTTENELREEIEGLLAEKAG